MEEEIEKALPSDEQVEKWSVGMFYNSMMPGKGASCTEKCWRPDFTEGATMRIVKSSSPS